MACTSSSSLIFNVAPSRHPLHNVPAPVRSLILDCMDDLSAIRFLSSCRSLHAGYHAYPLKQAMSVDTFLSLMPREAFSSVQPIEPVDCCSMGRFGRVSGRQMPRVVQLKESPRDGRMFVYLQHLTELTTAYDKKDRPFELYPLPRSLLTLRLLHSPDLVLTPHTLPPRLTMLSLSKINNMPLRAGVLPRSLTLLYLTLDFDLRWPIHEGVLPSSLQRLWLARWTFPLSRIALPMSLTDLDIRYLSNHPLPVLPPLLEVLHIGGAFNQPLAGVLPSSLRVLRLTDVFDQPLTNALPCSLRVLRLTGRFDQPLTVDVFASTPEPEELQLGDHSARDVVGSELPRSLRLLRVGKLHSLIIAAASDTPPKLRRIMVPAEWNRQRVERLTRFSVAQGFMVEVGPVHHQV